MPGMRGEGFYKEQNIVMTKAKGSTKQYMTLTEAAEFFGYQNRESMRQWCIKGILPSVRNTKGQHRIPRVEAQRIRDAMWLGLDFKKDAHWTKPGVWEYDNQYKVVGYYERARRISEGSRNGNKSDVS